jgi:3-deoxy-7-phosphoheptulonate synthase
MSPNPVPTLTLDAAQLSAALPHWPSADDLEAVVTELRARPPLVRYDDCRALGARLATVARGDALVIQAGDCAEMFAEVSGHSTARKHRQIADLRRTMSRASGLPTVGVGRLAGQFAKPRSHPVEPGPDGVDLPVYRGDAVNGLLATLADRTPDPRRLLTAYDKSAQVLRCLRSRPGRRVWTSHEALLCEYEEALVRTDPATLTPYASSGHLLWIGDRTRQLGGQHVALLSGVANPVGVKLGPSATPEDVADLVEMLDPLREPGRLVLVPRLGAAKVASVLPGLVEAAMDAGARPVWLCDPMHANTIRLDGGRKTRAVDAVLSEALDFVRVLRGAGAHPGGLHLEVTPDDVTECVYRSDDATGSPWLPRYRTACDPRLNPEQARVVVDAFARAVAG